LWPASVRDVPLRGSLCPSDSSGSFFRNDTVSGTVSRLSKNNYPYLASGLSNNDNGYNFTSPAGQATVFGGGYGRQGIGTKIREITDGLGKTACVAEYLRGIDGDDVRGAPYSGRSGLQFIFPFNTPNSSAPDTFFTSSQFCDPAYNHNRPELNLPCSRASPQSAAARSRHAGGVYALFCDGRVEFVDENISLTTWRNFAWIADGQP